MPLEEMINNLCPQWILAKSSAHNLTHGVLMASMHPAGVESGRSQWYGPKLPAATVGQKHIPSGDTARKMSKKVS